MQKRVLCYAVACLFSVNVLSQYTYESGQDLYHLQTNANNFEGELAYEVSDDGISPAIDLSFNFTFYGSTFTQARMATNGCLHFGSSGSYCNDYTPDPINGQHTYTIYAFWTDLIRDNNSRMKSWGDNSKMIFGWYDMREYNRASDNSFEVILWNNNSFDLRYGHLDIINHDVLIGEVGSSKDNSYTYYYHDECSTGTTNSSTCVNTNWNNTTINTTLENGGSLYGSGNGNGVDCSNPLNDSSCSGYSDALLTQQCNISSLYSESCPLYWEAYDDQQCDLDPQYGPFCQGYRQEQDIGYFQEEEQFDYGYEEEEQFGYEEEPMFEDFVFEFEEQSFEEPEFIFEEQIVFEEVFSQEEYYEPFQPIHDLPIHEEEIFMPIEELLIDEFIFQETFLVEDYAEPNTFIELETIEQLEEWFEEETRIEEELADLDDPEEEFIEEIFEEEAVEEVFEAIEERMAEAEVEEERIEREEVTEEEFQEEFQITERENIKGESSISKATALRVVASTIITANQSVSGTNSGNSVHATGNSVAAGNPVSSSSNTGISTSSSPSMSDQFASSSAQTNQTLTMSVTDTVSSSTSISNIDTDIETTAEVVVADVQVQDVQNEIVTAVADVSTTSEADQIADKIIAANIEAQQEEIEQKQEDTGEYGDESKLIALIGYVPDFNQYRTVSLPDQEKWYSERVIYTKILNDNTQAFYGLASQSIDTLSKLKKMQPNL
jgi:hypothetical protein